MSLSSPEAPFEGHSEEPAFEMVDMPEPTADEQLGLYAIYRRMGGEPIRELDNMALERWAELTQEREKPRTEA